MDNTTQKIKSSAMRFTINPSRVWLTTEYDSRDSIRLLRGPKSVSATSGAASKSGVTLSDVFNKAKKNT